MFFSANGREDNAFYVMNWEGSFPASDSSEGFDTLADVHVTWQRLREGLDRVILGQPLVKERALPPFTPCAECRDACSDAAREPDCRRLCEGGKPTACTMLAAHQLIDSKGKSIDRAVALLEKAAAAHDPSAAGTLGLFFVSGQGVKKDEARGARLLGEGKLDDTKAGFVSQGDDGESVHRTRSHIANLTTNTSIGDHTLTTVYSFAAYKINFVDDFDFGNKDATYFTRHEDYNQFSQEVRLTSPAGTNPTARGSDVSRSGNRSSLSNIVASGFS